MLARAKFVGRSARTCVWVTLTFALSCAGPAGPGEGSRPGGARPPAPERPPSASEPSDPPTGARPAPPPVARGEVALEGGEWTVTALDGQPLLEGSRITLDFQGGQVSGVASCNRYVADWDRLAAQRIRFGAARATLRACAPALMDQERLFLDLLGRLGSVEIDEEGELVLRTPAGEELRAARR